MKRDSMNPCRLFICAGEDLHFNLFAREGDFLLEHLERIDIRICVVALGRIGNQSRPIVVFDFI
jgi:hypothetical protein